MRLLRCWLGRIEELACRSFFVLQAILSVTCMICEFPLGVLTDKIGLKKSIVFAQFTMLTARIILLVSNNFMLFAVEALLEGIAFALNSGTISAYIYKLSAMIITVIIFRSSIIGERSLLSYQP